MAKRTKEHCENNFIYGETVWAQTFASKDGETYCGAEEGQWIR